MSTLSERTLGQSDRSTAVTDRGAGLNGRLPERPRDLQEVALILVDGTEVRGSLHRTKDTRTLDFLNRPAETFIAMMNVLLCRGDEAEHVSVICDQQDPHRAGHRSRRRRLTDTVSQPGHAGPGAREPIRYNSSGRVA